MYFIERRALLVSFVFYQAQGPACKVCRSYLSEEFNIDKWTNSVFCSEARIRQHQDEKLGECAVKACVKLLKTISDAQSTHPFTFSNKSLLLPVLDYCYKQVAESPSSESAPELALVQCMTILQNVLKCVAYREAPKGRILGENGVSHAELKGRLASQAQQEVQGFMSQEKLVHLCTLLIRR